MAPASTISFLSSEDTTRLAARFFIMARKLRVSRILLFFFLLFSLFFVFFADFIQGRAGAFSLDNAGSETSGSSIVMRFQTEGMVICGQSVLQGRASGNRFWRYILFFVIFACFIKTADRIVLLEYYLPVNPGRRFFHNLLISFFLGGRAPPVSAY